MNCMKCAAEIEDGQVFCERCLGEMKRYPVKPEAKIQLPNRPAQEIIKKPQPRKRAPSAEDKLRRYKKIVKWLVISLAAALLLLAFSISMLLEGSPAESFRDIIGQNYNTVGEDGTSD